LTLDTGHQIGQRHYLLPDRLQLESAVKASKEGQSPADLWLGYLELPTSPQELDSLMEQLSQRVYLFAAPEDGDLYRWLRCLGGYSPIIHLQQTDGSMSAHHPFTPPYNQTGIVLPKSVLNALLEAYRDQEPEGYPPRCQEIYLTIEVFSGTAERPEHILSKIRESVAYWRRFIPEDGLYLDQLAAP
jgi:hypothetical protein